MTDKPIPIPTGDHITKQYQTMRPLIRFLGLFSAKIRGQSKALEQSFAEIEQMKSDRATFAERFSQKGWTIYDRLSVEIVRQAINASEFKTAEQYLIDYHLDTDNLQYLGYSFNHPQFNAWQEIYERAVERAGQQDYLSAVPLVLIIIDGICTTKSGKHPFSGGADAPVFDTETSGPGGLAEGLAILGATRRKLETTAIESPFRHGILHGLNPSFGNSIVAAKSFNLLQTMVDYFDRRESEATRIARAAEEQRQPSWSELSSKIASTRDTKRLISEWKPRPKITEQEIAAFNASHILDLKSPEFTAASYLNAVIARNFGELAKLTIDNQLRPIAYRAGQHREELGDLYLAHWIITGISDEAAAVSIIDVSLTGTLNDQSWSGEQKMRLIYGDDKYRVLVRGSPSGHWAVMPNFLSAMWGTATASFRGSKP